MITNTYAELCTQALNWLKQKATNIGGYASSVPAAAKPGYYREIVTHTGDWHINNVAGGVRITTSSANTIPAVAASTVESQFRDYMTAAGISTSSGTVISASGLLTFWNAFAVFASNRLVTVMGSELSAPVIMYNPNTGFSTVPNRLPYDELITADTVNDMLNGFSQSVVKVNKVYCITYNIQAISSSSSSSCSSSSSSSSSSSWFIGYMQI